MSASKHFYFSGKVNKKFTLVAFGSFLLLVAECGILFGLLPYVFSDNTKNKTIMNANHQLSFLQERIEEIGSAIFYNLSESVLKLPTAIVSTLKVDDYGFVWFFVQKPTQNLKEFEQEFPVKLDFYRKGTGYFLQIAGQGFVVTDPEEMNAFVMLPDDTKKLASEKCALVKVKIQKAAYYETRSMHDATWWQSAWYTLTTWFRHNTYRHRNTYFPAS